jgi:predicted transcriptional regulator
MLHAMDTAHSLTDANAPVETEAERQHRITWEAARIAEARASVAAGRLVDAAEVDAWIDSIGTSDELPPRYRRG